MTAIDARNPSEVQDGQNVNPADRASRMAQLAVAKIQSQADEIEALRAENARLRSAFDASVIDYAVVAAEIERLREALKPFADAAAYAAYAYDPPQGHYHDIVWAQVRVSALRRARAALKGEGA